MTGLVENTGEARLGAVTATGEFYNAGGQLLSSNIWDIRDLAPGEVWEPWIPYAGSGEVDTAELSVTDAVAHSRTVNPEGLTIPSHDVEIPADEFAMPRVVATVANQTGTELSTVLARPKLFADNGHLLEAGITSVQNLGAGGTWSFDKRVHFANPDWISRLDKSQIVLTV